MESGQTVGSRNRDAHGHFLPGHSLPGPGAPTKAERDAQQDLASTFVEDLRDDWREHGKAVLEEVRLTKPDQYLRVITAVLPKTINLTGEVEVSIVSLLEQVQAKVIEGVAEVIDDDSLAITDVTESPAITDVMVDDLPPLGDELDALLEGL